MSDDDRSAADRQRRLSEDVGWLVELADRQRARADAYEAALRRCREIAVDLSLAPGAVCRKILDTVNDALGPDVGSP